MTTQHDQRTGEPPRHSRATAREWIGLAVLVLPMLALSTDLTVLFFALPTLSVDLQPSATQTLWISHVYGFLIAGFLVTAGRVGDRVGPRRLLLLGAIVFGALSIVAAFSTSAGMLIAARAALGVAGATFMPSLFSLVRTMFDDANQRRLAIAIMFSSFSVGGAIGPFLGGLLLEFFWWGAVFLINVPPVVLLVLVGPRLLPERLERNVASIDVVSVALSVTGMLAIVYGLQELAAGQESGSGAVWPYLGLVGLGALITTAFARRQRALRDPLFDLALLRSRPMAVSLGALLITGIGVVGMFYLFTQYLQWVAELSPLLAGLWTLPYIGVNIAGAMLAPSLAKRFSTATVVAAGLGIAVLGAGALVLAASPAVPLPALAATLAIIGLGHGMAIALVSDLIISSAPADKTGSAAAAQEVGGELGTALGIAVGGAVGMVVYRASLGANIPAGVPAEAADAAQASVHAGITTSERITADHPDLLQTVHDAVGHGLQTYAGVGAVMVAAAAGLVIVVLVRKERPARHHR